MARRTIATDATQADVTLESGLRPQKLEDYMGLQI